jgi:hypothetical protein
MSIGWESKRSVLWGKRIILGKAVKNPPGKKIPAVKQGKVYSTRVLSNSNFLA